MKKIFRSKVFWVVTGIIVIGIGAAAKFGGQEKVVSYTTEPVRRGEIVQTVSATGKIKSSSEIDLNFRQTGQLAAVLVKTGDVVTAGQTVAQLRNISESADVRRASADLQQAQAELDKLKAGATQQDIQVTIAAVAQAERDVTAAQTSLANTKTTYSQAIVNKRELVLSEIKTNLTKGNIALQEINDVLEFEGDEDNFMTLDSSAEIAAEDDYDQAIRDIDSAELSYELAAASPTSDALTDAAASQAIAVAQTIKVLLNDITELFDNVVISTSLTLDDLAGLKTSINTEQVTIDFALASLVSSRQSLIDARVSYDTSVDEATDKLAVAEKSLTKAKAELAFKQAPTRPEDISTAQAKVLRAQADVQSARDKLDQTFLRAPIAGVITDVAFAAGEQTSASTPVVTMLATEAYEIEVDIPESDITKIDIGQSAAITLDAFADTEVFSGIITTINPAQTEIQDVIYYTVTIRFAPEQPEGVRTLTEKIKPGMTANIDVETARKADVLLVPTRAIKQRVDGPIVEILVDGVAQEQTVALGLRGDGGLQEVASGVAEGDQVIVFVNEK